MSFDVYAIVDPRAAGALVRTKELIEVGGARLAVQIRAKDAGLEPHAVAIEALREVALHHGTALFVSTHVELAARAAIGVHLPESAPELDVVRAGFGGPIGVSCHDAAGLLRRRGADFAVLGPVGEVPGKGPALGWPDFAALARAASMPVYALGGIATEDDVRAALAHGARGVAVQRALGGDGADARLTRWLAASGTMRR